MKEALTPASLAYRTCLFGLSLICALAIFVFGSNYYKAFPTNGSFPYSASLSAVFLIAAILLKRSEKFSKYWQLAYAFFVASAVNLVSTLFAGYNTTILGSFGVSMETNQGLGLGKLYDTMLVLFTILVLVKLSGNDLGSLFLKKGNLKWGLCISVWFASIHTLSVSYLPLSVIPIFLVNTFTLGLACGYLMLRTDSIWGPLLIHAAADLFLFIATLAKH